LNPNRVMNKTRSYITPILMLLIGLAAIFAIILQMQHSVHPPRVIEKMSPGQRIAIIDSHYVNLPFNLTMRPPSPEWPMHIMSRDTVLNTITTDSSLFSQIHWMLEINVPPDSPKTVASRFGVLKAGNSEAQEIAIQLLANVLKRYEKEGERATIFKPVTTAVHPVLDGAYFGVVLPTSSLLRPVWVLTVLKREPWMFVILSQTTAESYPKAREDMRLIVAQFRALPRTYL